MYREIITPDSSSITINLPTTMIGKKIEVIAFEIEKENSDVSGTTKEKHLEKLLEYLTKYSNPLPDFKFDRAEANNYRGYAD